METVEIDKAELKRDVDEAMRPLFEKYQGQVGFGLLIGYEDYGAYMGTLREIPALVLLARTIETDDYEKNAAKKALS